MAWLKCCGIELAGVVSLPNPPSSEHRDIGHVGEAASGKTVVTRIARKRDLKFTTRPLSADDAAAWEALITGEGHVFSFDVSEYSSKGLGPSIIDNLGPIVSVGSIAAPKYGAKFVGFDIDQTLDLDGIVPATAPWTWAAWINNNGVFADYVWHHVVIRSDGKRWLDGVRNDSVIPLGFDFTDGDLHFSGGFDPPPVGIDDLVVFPALWPEDWPAQVYRAGVAFGAAPFLSMAGDMVREAATRTMICKSVSEKFLIANVGDGMERDVRTLEFDLAEV